MSYSHRMSDKQGRVAGLLLSSRQQGRVSVLFAYAGLGEIGTAWGLLVPAPITALHIGVISRRKTALRTLGSRRCMVSVNRTADFHPLVAA